MWSSTNQLIIKLAILELDISPYRVRRCVLGGWWLPVRCAGVSLRGWRSSCPSQRRSAPPCSADLCRHTLPLHRYGYSTHTHLKKPNAVYDATKLSIIQWLCKKILLMTELEGSKNCWSNKEFNSAARTHLLHCGQCSWVPCSSIRLSQGCNIPLSWADAFRRTHPPHRGGG